MARNRKYNARSPEEKSNIKIQIFNALVSNNGKLLTAIEEIGQSYLTVHNLRKEDSVFDEEINKVISTVKSEEFLDQIVDESYTKLLQEGNWRAIERYMNHRKKFMPGDSTKEEIRAVLGEYMEKLEDE